MEDDVEISELKCYYHNIDDCLSDATLFYTYADVRYNDVVVASCERCSKFIASSFMKKISKQEYLNVLKCQIII